MVLQSILKYYGLFMIVGYMKGTFLNVLLFSGVVLVNKKHYDKHCT